MYIDTMATLVQPVRITGAVELQSELLETAAAIGLVVETLRVDLPSVTSHWEGRRRLEFDDDMRAYLAEAEALAAAALSLHALVGEHSTAAIRETLRRTAEFEAAVALEQEIARRAAETAAAEAAALASAAAEAKAKADAAAASASANRRAP